MAPVDAWPVLFFTFPVLVWLTDGAAGGRLGGVPGAAVAGWWFGFGYHPRWAVLGRQRLPGRCQDLRLAAAFRGHRAAGRHGALHRAWARARAHALDARTVAAARACGGAHRHRMAARLLVHRVSLEHLWLRADRPTGAGARRGTDRRLGFDVYCGRGVRKPGGAARRTQRYAAALAAACTGRRGARGARGLRRAAAVNHAVGVCRQCAASHHAAQPAAGREVQLLRQTAGDESVSRSVGPLHRPAVFRRARRDASDLAGVGVSLSADARTRRAWRRSRRCCRKAPC